MKKLSTFILTLLLLFTFIPAAHAANYDTYTVKVGDTMWKIALRYKVGVPEIVSTNSQIKNSNMIYPGQKVNVPLNGQASSIEMQVAELTNQERAKHGLKPLTFNWELSRVARDKSEDMIAKNYFSHTSPTYGSPFDMMKAYGVSYRTAGENIASGQKSAQAVVTAWMNSEGHRKNILNPSFTEIGVGYATKSNGTPYWTQMFIGR